MSKKAKIDRAQKAFLKAMKEKFTEDPRTFTDPYDDLVSVLPTRDSGSCPSSSLLRALEEDRACYQAVIDKREHELAHVDAISGGTDALVEVTVRLSKDGKIITSRGARTDIIMASVEAMIAGMNRLLEDRP